MQVVKIGETTVEVDENLFREYVKESLTYLQAADEAAASFKEAVETMSETFKIDKKVVGKFLKQHYKEKLDEAIQEAEDLDALNKLIE